MPNPTTHYQIGGSLQLDSPTYVTRRADAELYDGLKAGEFCYVLNSRQMGKSSLRVRTMARLQAEGVACVAVQMTDIIDEETTPEQFYAGVIDSITQDLSLDFDNEAWWEANASLSLVNRFSKFLATVLLRQVSGNLVIFIDEVDRVLSLPFKVNGFFAAIRECYNKRADVPDFRRLTFALLGVATPSDLIEDKRSTPFNVGRAIELTGFTPAEAQPLTAGLGVANGPAVLAAILNWTGGQPFLTQKVCRLVAAQALAEPSAGAQMSPEAVTDLIQAQVIRNWQSNDEPEHLRTIRDRLVKNEQKAARWLGLYQKIWAEGGLPTDGANTDHIELRLSGLVVERQGWLRVYNPIYREIFNPAWAAQTLANLRSYAGELEAWLASERTDISWLLRGQALVEAKAWSADKVLPPEDYAFLAASQELATAEAEAAKETLALANLTLEEANREATARIDSANRRLRIGSGILLGTIALAALAGGSAVQINAAAREERAAADQQLSEAQVATEQAEEDKQEAQTNLERANIESERIRQDSERRAAEADQQVSTALVKTQEAERAQADAQQQASEAQQLSARAQQDAAVAQRDAEEARQAEVNANKQQALALEGSRLEKLGIALLRRPSVSFRGMSVLLESLKYGKQLQDLQQSERELNKDYRVVDMNKFPATSPMLALRTTVNSVLETTVLSDSIAISPITGARMISEDGNRLVTYSRSDDTSRLYDGQGTELNTLSGAPWRFSEDGNRFVTYSSSDDTSRLYDGLGTELNTLSGEPWRFSEDGNRLVTYSSSDDTSRLYAINTGKQIGNPFKGFFREFHPDGQYLVTTIRNENISHVYDLSGNLLAEYLGSVTDDQNQTESDAALGFTADGKHLITISNDGYFHRWPLDDGLDDLLAKGCDWVRPHLQSNPEETRAQFCLE
ncbi:MAG: AAA-like domain-containing protein [Cyanobacteria bacterium P01_D01_bin.105]